MLIIWLKYTMGTIFVFKYFSFSASSVKDLAVPNFFFPKGIFSGFCWDQKPLFFPLTPYATTGNVVVPGLD